MWRNQAQFADVRELTTSVSVATAFAANRRGVFKSLLSLTCICVACIIRLLRYFDFSPTLLGLSKYFFLREANLYLISQDCRILKLRVCPT